jgi:hypothetical protein
MLTITTNKDEIAEIAAGDKKEKALPLSDFWEKRIINLLGFSDSDARTIIHNLREDRKGTTDAEREVRFTAGGAASVRVMATFKIGRINPLAAETYILTIKEVLEVAGIENHEEPEVIGEDVTVEGMPTAPAVRTVSQHTGFCKYCNQAQMIEAPDGLSAADYNELATAACNCDEAMREREKRAKMEAAGMWAKNIFSQQDGQLQLVLCAIRATFDGNVDYATIKIGKNTHKIDRDSDGMIRIKTTYRDSNEETF